MAVGRDEALQFMQKVGVQGGADQLACQPLTSINSLIRGFAEHVAFQTVSLMAESEETRHVPTLEEVVAAGLSLEGGLCFTLNTFMCLLLRGLNLDAYVLPGTHIISSNCNTHPVLLLKDLRFPGDAHIIDVGGGYPLQEAVALADLPTEYSYGGHEYRFEKKGDTVDILFGDTSHRKNEPSGEEDEDMGNWNRMFELKLTPVDFKFFYPYLDAEYVKDDARFLSSLRAVRFPATIPEMKSSGGGDVTPMVAIVNHSLLLGPADAADKKKVCDEDMVATIKQYFPHIPPSKVDLAVQRLRNLPQDQS